MATISFGDARYDADANAFRFNAVAGGKTVRCMIPIFAVEELAERSGDAGKPLDLFEDVKHQIQDLVRRKHASYGLGSDGTMTLTILDVVSTRQH